MNNGNEQAMPCNQTDDAGVAITYHEGLTKREHFAGLAMQGLMADSYIEGELEDVAHFAVKMADALLKELAK